MVALRQMIAEGSLGTVLQIEANFSQDKFLALPKDNWRLSNAQAPVGPLTATGIHLVDLSIAVLGPCEQVWARLATLASDFENGDTLAVMMAFASGANAMISAVLATPFEGRFAVYGSMGWVEIRDRTHPDDPTGWDVTTALRGEPPHTRFAAPSPSVRDNLEAFAMAVRGVRPVPGDADRDAGQRGGAGGHHAVGAAPRATGGGRAHAGALTSGRLTRVAATCTYQTITIE